MESAPEIVRVTRKVTQCGLCALVHVTHLLGDCRTEASRPFHEALSSRESHGGQAGSQARAPSGGLPPPPRPSGSCHSSWKTTEEIKWKQKSDPQSLPLPRARTSPPQCTQEGAQPQRHASPEWLALARPSGHDRRSWTSSSRARHPLWSRRASPSASSTDRPLSCLKHCASTELHLQDPAQRARLHGASRLGPKEPRPPPRASCGTEWMCQACAAVRLRVPSENVSRVWAALASQSCRSPCLCSALGLTKGSSTHVPERRCAWAWA